MKKKVILFAILLMIISIPIIIKVTHKSETPKTKTEEKINTKEETKTDESEEEQKTEITKEKREGDNTSKSSKESNTNKKNSSTKDSSPNKKSTNFLVQFNNLYIYHNFQMYILNIDMLLILFHSHLELPYTTIHIYQLLL